jgi:hypothetical protein
MIGEWAIANGTIRGTDTADLETKLFPCIDVFVLAVASLVSGHTLGYLTLKPIILILISHDRCDVHTEP